MNKQGSPLPEAEARIASVSEHYRLARNQAAADPYAALLHARLVAEAVCQHVFVDRISANVSGMALDKILSLLKDGHLPPSLQPHFRAIQGYGNFGCHAQTAEPGTMTPDYVKGCIGALDSVVNWYFVDYLKRPVPTMDDNAKPVPAADKSGDESDKRPTAPNRPDKSAPLGDDDGAATALLIGAVGGAAAALLGAALAGKAKKKRAESIKEILDKMKQRGQPNRK